MKSSFKSCEKQKLFFYYTKHFFSFLFETKIYIFMLSDKYFFKIPENLIAVALFLQRHILKNIHMPK